VAVRTKVRKAANDFEAEKVDTMDRIKL